MEMNDEAKAKIYVCEFPDSRRRPRIVRGWRSVQKIRKNSNTRVTFRAFHTYERAEEYLIERLRPR